MSSKSLMNELALFAGAGGGVLGGKLRGWRTVCAVERDAYAAAVLAQRQNDGCLEPFPIWSDVETFDGKPWRGIVDIVSGGFPCQDTSCAGKGRGIDGKRSGVWVEMARIIGEIRPQFAFVENSPTLLVRGVGKVFGDLAEMGFDIRWGIIGARHVGACHRRDRLWICAHNSDFGSYWTGKTWKRKPQFQNVVSREQHRKKVTEARGNNDDMAGWLGQCWKAIGNGQVPAVAALAWKILTTK